MTGWRIYAPVNWVNMYAVMAYLQFGVNPLPQSVVIYCQLDPLGQASVKFEPKYKISPWKNAYTYAKVLSEMVLSILFMVCKKKFSIAFERFVLRKMLVFWFKFYGRVYCQGLKWQAVIGWRNDLAPNSWQLCLNQYWLRLWIQFSYQYASMQQSI